MIFGLHAKTASLDPRSVDAALNSLSLDGARELRRFTYDRFVGASVAEGGATVAPCERLDTLALVAGHPSDPANLAGRIADLSEMSAPPAGAKGSYAFARYQADGHRLVLGNDAFGFQPLFLVETDEFIAFCSEYEPLLELPGVERTLDADAIAQYYAFGLTLDNRTLLRAVRMLPAGTIRTIDASGSSRDRRHDELAIPLTRGATVEQHARTVGAALQEAVQRGMDAYPAAVVGLTGGADTRMILSCMTEEQRRRHRFVTHYAEKGAESRDRDVVVAAKVAVQAGLAIEAQFLESGHQPFDPSVFDFHRRKAFEDGTMHGGILGGEYLGGCCVDVALFPVREVTRSAVTRRLEELFTQEFIDSLSEHPYDTLQRELQSIRAENQEMALWVQLFARPFFSQWYGGSCGVRTSTWMIPWQMHQRVLSPFADPDFLRALLAVPFEFITGYRLYNEMFRTVFPEFNGVPTNSGLAVRSDSALTMYTGGEEPKKARVRRVVEGRRQAIARHTNPAGTPDRAIYRCDRLAALLRDEQEAEERTSVMTKLKNVYTRSPLFKVRHALPIHGMLMKWKAKNETATAARLSMPVVPAFADFEDWCTYAQAETPGPENAN